MSVRRGTLKREAGRGHMIVANPDPQNIASIYTATNYRLESFVGQRIMRSGSFIHN